MMKKVIVLSGFVLLACLPLLAQMEARTKNKGDYQLSTKFGTEVGMTTMSNVISMRDAASGLPTGKRMHKPFVITKELDKSSPLLFQAMTNHQVVPSMELNFTGAPPFPCVNSRYSWDLKSGTKGKVLLSDITITRIVKVSPTTEEVTIEAALTTVTADDQMVDCRAIGEKVMILK